MGKTIPEIPLIDPNIKEAASRGKLITFIGAGVSRIAGFIDWRELVKLYLNKAIELNIIDHYDKDKLSRLSPRQTLTICRKIIDKKYIQADLIKAFEIEQKKNNNLDIFEALYSFNTVFITTNYDNGLDKELEKKQIQQTLEHNNESRIDYSKCKIIFRNDKLLKTDLLIPGNIVHIHGSILQPESMVIGITEYFKLYKENEYMKTFLKDVFDGHCVLFIGYGLDEFEILEFLIEKNKSGNEIRHYALQGFYEHETRYVKLYNEYYNELGVQIIPYCLNKSEYGQLKEIIKRWASEISIISKPPQFLDKLKLIDKVL